MPLLGLLPGTPATADWAAALIAPTITTVQGLPPARNAMSAGIGIAGAFTRVANVPAYPKVATFTMLGEKICVSCTPSVWACMSEVLTKFGSPPPPPPQGRFLSPLSAVKFPDKESLLEML